MSVSVIGKSYGSQLLHDSWCLLEMVMLVMLLNVMKVVILLSVIALCKGLTTSTHNVTQHEKVLMNDLFHDYNKQVRPVFNQSQLVYVGFEIALSEILELNAKNQVLITNVWTRQRWKDESLVWNSSMYGGITSINIDPQYPWKPDILLYNNVQSTDNGEQYLFKTKITITNDGTISWFSPNKLTTSCPIKIENFSFDTQQCTMTFGSWTYTGSKLKLQFWNNKSQRVDLSKYSKNAEFDLTSAEGKLNRLVHTCCPDPFYDTTYTLVLKRRPLFYLNNLILPCITLAIITGISFLFPPETGERISLVVTVLLGMTVFMIVFTEFIPASSEATPLIGKYFTTVLFEVAACLLATCVPLRLHHLRPGTEMPNWLKIVIFDYLAFVLCIRCKVPKKLNQRFGNANVMDVSKATGHKNNAVVIDVENNEKKSQGQAANNSPLVTTRQHIKPYDLESALYYGIVTMKNYVNKMERDDEASREWKDAVAILDRLFLWLFLITFAASSMLMLLTI